MRAAGSVSKRQVGADGDQMTTLPYVSNPQELPQWLSYSTLVVTDGDEVYTTQSVIQLPLTYYGPSIPLGPDWTYGGVTSPASTELPDPTITPASTIQPASTTSPSAVLSSSPLDATASADSSSVSGSASAIDDGDGVGVSGGNTSGMTASSGVGASFTTGMGPGPLSVPTISPSSSEPGSSTRVVTSSSAITPSIAGGTTITSGPITSSPSETAIIPSSSLSSSINDTSNSTSLAHDPSSLTPLLISTIVIGVLLALLFCFVCAACLFVRRRNRRDNGREEWLTSLERDRRGEGVGLVGGLAEGDVRSGDVAEGGADAAVPVIAAITGGEDAAHNAEDGQGHETEGAEGTRKAWLPAALGAFAIRRRTPSSRYRVPSNNPWDDEGVTVVPPILAGTGDGGPGSTQPTSAGTLPPRQGQDVDPETRRALLAGVVAREARGHGGDQAPVRRNRVSSALSKISAPFRTRDVRSASGPVGSSTTLPITDDSSFHARTPTEEELFFHVPLPPLHSPELSEEAAGIVGRHVARNQSISRRPPPEYLDSPVRQPGFEVVYPDTSEASEAGNRFSQILPDLPRSGTTATFPDPPPRIPSASGGGGIGGAILGMFGGRRTRPSSWASRDSTSQYHSIPPTPNFPASGAISSRPSDMSLAYATPPESSGSSSAIASGPSVRLLGIAADEHGRMLSRRVPSGGLEEADVGETMFVGGTFGRARDSLGSLIGGLPSTREEEDREVDEELGQARDVDRSGTVVVRADRAGGGLFEDSGSSNETSQPLSPGQTNTRFSRGSYPGHPIVPEEVYHQAWEGDVGVASAQHPDAPGPSRHLAGVGVPLSAVGSRKTSSVRHVRPISEFGHVAPDPVSGIASSSRFGGPLNSSTLTSMAPATTISRDSRPVSQYASILHAGSDSATGSSTDSSSSYSREGTGQTHVMAEMGYSTAALRGRRSMPLVMPHAEALRQLSSTGQLTSPDGIGSTRLPTIRAAPSSPELGAMDDEPAATKPGFFEVRGGGGAGGQRKSWKSRFGTSGGRGGG